MSDAEKVQILQTQLEAWETVFGTRQLSHASAAFNSFKKRAERAEAACDEEWLSAIGKAHMQLFGKPWETRDGETREEGLEANVTALFQLIEDSRDKAKRLREALRIMLDSFVKLNGCYPLEYCSEKTRYRRVACDQAKQALAETEEK